MLTMTKSDECLVLIPARGGSKGIPRKNLALLGGKPLIEYSIKAALKANLPGRICVSTDDEEIRDVALRFPIEAPFLRPSELAQDDSGTIPVITHALHLYETDVGFVPNFIVLLQPTCPFRSAKSIREAYNSVRNSGVDSLISVNPVREHPCEYIVRRNGDFAFVLPPPSTPGRQNFPEVFFINGAIYIAQVSYIKAKEKLFDETAQLFVIGRHESIDIDDPEDLEFANWLLREHRINI